MQHLSFSAKLKRWYRLLAILSSGISVLIIVWTVLSALVISYAYLGQARGMLVLHFAVNGLILVVNTVLAYRLLKAPVPAQLDQTQFKLLAHRAQISFTANSLILLTAACVETIIVPSLIDQSLR